MSDVTKAYYAWHEEAFRHEPSLEDAFLAGAAWRREQDAKLAESESTVAEVESPLAKGELTLAELRKTYQDFSGKAGELVRQSGYAGIAMIWALKPADGVIPPDLYRAALFLFFTLFADFLTYLIPTYIWAGYHLRKEKELLSAPQTKFLAPICINWPYNIFAALRYLFVICAYYLIIGHLLEKYPQSFSYLLLPPLVATV
jgi:hypothetical protein